jgi:hypothetical protein
MDMKALRRLIETHARMKQRHETVSPGKVKLGWLRINKQSKRIGTTVGKNKKFPEHDKRVKRLAMEDLNAEAGFLNEMLEQSTYIEISELYYNYCAAMGIRPPPREQRYEFKTQQYVPEKETQDWVKRFEWIITEKALGMKQCENDSNVFIKHDRDGQIVLWAVTQRNDVIYGGLKDETDSLKKQMMTNVMIVEIGKLDMHSGVEHMLKAKVYTPDFAYSMERYMGSTNWKEATHIKHAENIYNGTFHPTIGEGVESTAYVRPYGRNGEQATATKMEGTNASGTETTVRSFRSEEHSSDRGDQNRQMRSD